MHIFKRHMVLAAVSLGLLMGCKTTPETAIAPAACSLSEPDKAWLDDGVGAWSLVSDRFLPDQPPFTVIVFSGDCILTSDTAFSGGENAWTAEAYQPDSAAPWGAPLTLGPAAYATEHKGKPYFLMAAPSVWRAAGVPPGPFGLETLMTAVLLHEAAHASQPYFTRFAAIAEAQNLPEDFNDDSIQEKFKENAEFAASIRQETDLLFAAATTPDDGEALALAIQARDLIKARRARWYTGADAFLAETEDIFWAMEGSGQWMGYQWLTSPSGAGISTDIAMADFARRGGWWSQEQGLALVLAADRLGEGAWRRDAFGSAERGALQYLEEAIDLRSRT